MDNSRSLCIFVVLIILKKFMLPVHRYRNTTTQASDVANAPKQQFSSGLTTHYIQICRTFWLLSAKKPVLSDQGFWSGAQSPDPYYGLRSQCSPNGESPQPLLVRYAYTLLVRRTAKHGSIQATAVLDPGTGIGGWPLLALPPFCPFPAAKSS